MAGPFDGLRSKSMAFNGSTSYAADQLPSGSCNYRELSRGVKSPVCGCKRFWLNATNPVTRPGSDDNASCFCGHHACFHNAFSQQSSQRLGLQQPPLATNVTHNSNNGDSHNIAARKAPKGYVAVSEAGAAIVAPSGLGIRPESRSQSQSINTRIWNALNGFARGQDGGDDTSTHLPSTAASFIGDAIAAPRPMNPPLFTPGMMLTRPGCDDFPCSATEIATPSVAGTPDLRVYAAPGAQTKHGQLQSAPPVVTSPRQSLHPDATISHQPQISPARHLPHDEIVHLLQAHGERLAALESLSFSQIPTEEVADRFELAECRLLDLEQWRGDEEERARQESDKAANGSKQNLLPKSRKRRLLPAETSSFASDESFDMTAAAHAEAAVLATIATNAEIGPRIEDLEGRVADLEKLALPSYAQPWEIEVVLLPWGSMLRGIWFSSEDATQHSMHTSAADLDEWAGTQSQLKTSFRSSSSHGAWTTESIQAWAEDAQDWLSAKACGPQTTVFQRLASRGFVRSVTLTSAAATHICNTIASTFADVLDITGKEHTDLPPHYLALRQPLIPLRKIRKSARLRFLDPAEMVTPAIWTARFLDSSVFMKVSEGQRRLYVTTPHAYLQESSDGLSWPSIRQMPIRDSNGEVQPGQIDPRIAIEACWSYNDKLDYIPSLHASFASHASHQSAWSTKSQQSFAGPHEKGGQLTPALSNGGTRFTHNRTASSSLPGSASGMESVSDSLPKRRVASFETVPSIPMLATTNLEAHKRRRLSASQEAERRGVNFTPRWSREPPSPFNSEHAVESRSQAASTSRKRGNTPFAYATPHSNAHFVDRIDLPGDGDTEHDSVASQDGEADDEEWNGMDAAASKSEEFEASGETSDGHDKQDIDSEDDSYEEDVEDMND